MMPLTEEGKKLIRSVYPVSGTRDLVGPLGRPARAIRQDAHRIGVSHKPACRNSKAFDWPPEKDGILRANYPLIAMRSHPMTLKKLAAMVGASRLQTCRRALVLGLIVARTKEPRWSRDEEEFLADNCHKSVRWLKDQMTAKGWPKRTETAVASKRKRAQMAATFTGNAYTANELARMMGAHSKTVTRWISGGLLAAKPRTSATDPNHGGVGDRWEIEPEAVKRFIFAHPAHYRLATVDQDWFLSIVEPKKPPDAAPNRLRGGRTVSSPIDTLGSTCIEVYRLLREHGALDRQRIVELVAANRDIKLTSDAERRRIAKLCSSALGRLFRRNAVTRPYRAVWAPLPETGIKPADWKLAAKRRASQTGRLSAAQVEKLPDLLKEQAEWQREQLAAIEAKRERNKWQLRA